MKPRGMKPDTGAGGIKEDANEMRRQIDLIILTLETSRQALLEEEIKPMPNPLEGDGLGIGEAMIQADVLRREGMRDGACGALSYAIKLLGGASKERISRALHDIIASERKRDI